MTTVKHGVIQMVSVSSVMTVMVMHGKMEMPLMENVHTTMGLKLMKMTQSITAQIQIMEPLVEVKAPKNMTPTANASMLTKSVPNATQIMR